VAAPKEGNPVWMLFIAHFMPCVVIYNQYVRLKPQFFNPEMQEQVGMEFIAYSHLWMALLFVVADGFKELDLSDPTISPIIEANFKELKLFRNSVFHFQRSARKREQFIDAEKLNWAQELHAAFEKFFAAQDNA
jgi:hypothetical protein